MVKQYKKTFDNKIVLSNTNFQKILEFYLFQCPVDGTSQRGVTFKTHGWYGSTQFAQLKKRMLVAASDIFSSYYFPCTKEQLKEYYKNVERAGPLDEYCVFLKNQENTILQSLFSAIRNAFAHGSFRVCSYNKTRVYFLANYNKYLKAEIVLREDTLLSWIDIVKSGYAPN